MSVLMKSGLLLTFRIIGIWVSSGSLTCVCNPIYVPAIVVYPSMRYPSMILFWPWKEFLLLGSTLNDREWYSDWKIWIWAPRIDRLFLRLQYDHQRAFVIIWPRRSVLHWWKLKPYLQYVLGLQSWRIL